ncbi:MULTISPECIES: hypothetical protein [Thermotoga]|uniref:hypothetical protein n=1 Tax=Thermotoga TaxID=2335 RepID=UPI000597A353|nr:MULTISPECIES: hypothetical protein [Thermotoga]KAF2958609.1 hypothetical protein AS159_02675 [Thermotoga sp. Ku-13t]
MNVLELFNLIGRIVMLGVCLVERPKDGANKKQEVKKMVYQFLNDFNIKVPMPQPVFDFVLDFMIDNIVKVLNKTLWKENAA